MRKLISGILAALFLFMLLPATDASAASAYDKYYYLQWGLHNDGTFSSRSKITENTSIAGIDINIENAWEEYVPSRGVTVALIDTGVDMTNTDLTEHLWTNPGEIEGNRIDDDGNGFVDDVHGWNFRAGTDSLYTAGQDSHGTHCFSTIAAGYNSVGIAGICGVTNAVDVMVLKVFDGENATGRTADIVKAIRYAEANGASIVNLSLGVEQYNSSLYQAIKTSNMLFIVASGNSGNNSDSVPIYPAAFDLDNIISVANLCCDGTLSSSSNYGAKTVDLAAPGTNILGCGTSGKYYYMTGTSMAAPMVTGVCALVYSHFPTISLSDVKSTILNTVHPLSSLTGKTVTGGMLDAGAALGYCAPAVQVPEPTPEPPQPSVQPSAQPSGQGAASNIAFSDVHESDWFYSYVSTLASKGVVNGYSDGTFKPRSSVTVGEVLKLTLLAAGYGEQAPTDSGWASGYRDLALSLGFVAANEVKNLSAPASRLFIACTAARAMKLSPDYGVSPFSDVSDPYVTALYNAGIIEGSISAGGQRVYKPADDLARSEVCAIVCRMVK